MAFPQAVSSSLLAAAGLILSLTLMTSCQDLSLTLQGEQEIILNFNPSSRERDIDIASGFNYTISCRREGNSASGPNQAWYLGNTLISSDTSQRIHAARVDGTNEITWNLVMSPFTAEDAGSYRCDDSESMLTLNVAAENPAVSVSTPYLPLDSGNQGSSLASLRVIITGNPQPLSDEIQWFFNGVAGNFPGNAFQSPSGDFILNTRLSNEDDTGNYTCVVTTSEGVASAEVFVQVVVVPSITIFSTIPEVANSSTYLVNGSGNITCSDSTGIPPPTFSWRINGTTLNPGEGVVITTNGSTSDLQVSTLLLTSVTLSSVGLYECIAQNSPTSSVYTPASVDIIVLLPPAPISNVMVTPRSPCTVDIEWDVSTTTESGTAATTDRYTIEIQLMTGQGNTEWMELGTDSSRSLRNVNLPLVSLNTTFFIRGFASNTRLGRGMTSDVFGPYISHQDNLLPSPEDLVPIPAGPNSINITWSIPESAGCYVFTNFTVVCLEDGNTNSSSSVMVRSVGGAMVGVVTGLVSDTLYECHVTGRLIQRLVVFDGVNGEESQSSEIIRTFTLPNVPPSPDMPKLSNKTITFSSFNVTLVPSPDSQNISHYQVLVLRLGTNQLPQVHPDQLYKTNSSFSTCEEANDISNKDSPFQPYVASEISASNFNTEFKVGAESGTGDRCNGKLLPGVPYTVFLRAYPMSFYDREEFTSGRGKREVGDGARRQYVVFSSSNFLSPVTTSISVGPDGGQNTSPVTVIIIVMVVVLTVLAVIIAAFLFVVLFCAYKRRNSRSATFSPSVDNSSSSSACDLSRYPDTPDLGGDRKNGMEMKVMEAFSDPMDIPFQPSGPIRRGEFAYHVEKFDAKRQLLFQEEFEWITKNSPWHPSEASNDPYNDHKNRYSNITAFDHSAVKLEPIPGVECSDYINANYIAGYSRPHEYIATQGPLERTVEDFWRMVWEQKTSTIIMLTNVVELGKIKCTQYWPNSNKLMYGQIAVTLEDTHVFPDYTIRTFSVQSAKTNELRRVLQFHYNKWPDYGTPKLAAPLLNFLKIVHESNDLDPSESEEEVGPMVVHCSAGVGRSGTVLTIDYCLQQLKQEAVANISGFVRTMREQRNYMVQTDQQYTFIHYAILEAINYGDTSYEVGRFMSSYAAMQKESASSSTSMLVDEFGRLDVIKTMVKKSSFQTRIRIKGAPQRHFHSSFHGGSMSGSLQLCLGHLLDGYNQSNMFVLTEGPDADTTMRFWEMVWDHNCENIVMLTPMDSENLFRYWPGDGEAELQFGSIKVMVESETAEHFYTMRKIRLTNTKVEVISHTVIQYQFLCWTIEFLPRVPDFVGFVCDIMSKIDITDIKSRILVHDTSSLGPAGIFSALYYCIQRLQIEKMVDIFQAVQMVQLQRPGCVASLDEYAFIYDCVNEFLMKNS